MSSTEVAKKWSKIDIFAPQIWGRAPEIFIGGIFKSTPLPTYWPSLVDISLGSFHVYADEIKNAQL